MIEKQVAQAVQRRRHTVIKTPEEASEGGGLIGVLDTLRVVTG